MDFSIAATVPRGHGTASAKVGFERKVKIPDPILDCSCFVYTRFEFVYSFLLFILHNSSFVPSLLPFCIPRSLMQSRDWYVHIAQKSGLFFYTLASCTNLRFFGRKFPVLSNIFRLLVIFGIILPKTCISSRFVLYYG